MAAMTSFHAEKCCCLVNAHEGLSGAYAATESSSWSIVHLQLLCTLFLFCTTWSVLSELNMTDWLILLAFQFCYW